MSDDADRPRRVREALARAGLILPADIAHEGAGWLTHDGASLIELRTGQIIPPSDVMDARHDAVRTLAYGGHGPHPSQFEHDTPCWLVGNGERVGTIALGPNGRDEGMLRVSSLYLHPSFRRHGHATHILRSAYRAALDAGLDGLRLTTQWSWPGAVHVYVALRMWVWSWKHDFTFVWRCDLPSWDLELDGDRARFVLIDPQGGRHPAITARHHGTALGWGEHFPDDAETLLRLQSIGTFSLALASLGWPLIRSPAHWEEQLTHGFSDFGGPEGLAYQIQLFEAWDRRHGWIVAAPRIPGLKYPDWDAILRHER